MKPEWKRKARVSWLRKNGHRYSHTVWRDDALGVQRETIANSRGKRSTSYFIDGDKREFDTEGEMLAALKGKGGAE